MMSKKTAKQPMRKVTGVPSQAAVPPQRQAEGRDGDLVANRLVTFVESRYRLGVADTGEPFAVPFTGPNVGILFSETRSFRQELLADYRAHAGKLVSLASANTAIECLSAIADKREKESLPLRVASYNGDWIVDMADEAGRAIVVTPGGGWQIAERSPVTFRRTVLLAPHVEPCRGASPEDLRKELGVSTEKWSLILGWMIATFLTDVPRPLLVLEGSRGSGKSVLMSRIMDLVDPTEVIRRSEPRSPQDWQVAASGCHVVPIDNVATIPSWLSECLCRASTGDASIYRKLYANKELSIMRIKVPVIMTTIGLDVARNDLDQRVLSVPLEPMPSTQRRTERDLNARWSRFRPSALGALLDALSSTLASYKKIPPIDLPRMADFGEVLALMDAAGVTHGARKAYQNNLAEAEHDAIRRDVFVWQVVEIVRERQRWEGSATELIAAVKLRPAKSAQRGLPSPRGVRSRLQGWRDGLMAMGIDVQFKKGQDRRIIFTYDPEHDLPPESPYASDGAPDGGDPPFDADESWESGNECR